jgi:hypothetical protein
VYIGLIVKWLFLHKKVMSSHRIGISAENALELLKQRFSQTLKDAVAEEALKREAKRMAN